MSYVTQSHIMNKFKNYTDDFTGGTRFNVKGTLISFELNNHV